MAIDARIQFGTQNPQILSQLTKGVDLANTLRRAPILDRIMENRADAGEQDLILGDQQIEENDQAAEFSRIATQGRIAEAVLSLPDEQSRRSFLNRIAPRLFETGVTTPEELQQLDLSDNSPDLQALVARGQAISGETGKPVGVPLIVQTPDGPAFATQMLQPNGTLTAKITPIQQAEVADRKGLTSSGRVSEAGDVATVRQTAQTGGFGDRRGVEEDTAAGISRETARGSGISARQVEDMALGTDAARGIPILRRSLELLQIVKTGGLPAAQLAVKQAFGIEGADEGELSANLGKAVLSQLRTVFGAQFTEQEGRRLEGIEARFGANTTTNVRLLRQTLKLAEDSANRGIRAAVAAKDFRKAADIQEAMNLSLTPAEAILSPEKQARLEELRRKQIDGTIQ